MWPREGRSPEKATHRATPTLRRSGKETLQRRDAGRAHGQAGDTRHSLHVRPEPRDGLTAKLAESASLAGAGAPELARRPRPRGAPTYGRARQTATAFPAHETVRPGSVFRNACAARRASRPPRPRARRVVAEHAPTRGWGAAECRGPRSSPEPPGDRSPPPRPPPSAHAPPLRAACTRRRTRGRVSPKAPTAPRADSTVLPGHRCQTPSFPW